MSSMLGSLRRYSVNSVVGIVLNAGLNELDAVAKSVLGLCNDNYSS